MLSEFSERQFEFAFNNEFVNTYRTGLPFLPTLNQEAFFGYDVRYDIRQGFRAIPLMLQFKVSYFVTRCSRTNAHIYRCYNNGSYFRFPIMLRNVSRQHQIMLRTARRGESIFYCAPLFHESAQLQNYFARNTIIQNSRLFDPLDMGDLPDDRQHHVSYDPSGQFGFFHSENKKDIKVLNWEKIISISKPKIINEDYLYNFKKILMGILKEEHQGSLKIPERFDNINILYQINYLLRFYVDASWFLIPVEERNG